MDKVIRYGHPKITVVVGADSDNELEKQINYIQSLNKQYESFNYKIGVIELRLDMLKNKIHTCSKLYAERIKQRLGLPVLVSCRREGEIGVYKIEENERINILEGMIDKKYSDIIDIEYTTEPKERITSIVNRCKEIGIESVISIHSHKNMLPVDYMYKVYSDSFANFKADAVKICTTPRNNSDVFNLLRFCQYNSGQLSPTIVIGMGKKGQLTRILSPYIGSPLTYASISDDTGIPGIIRADKMLKMFNEMKPTETIIHNFVLPEDQITSILNKKKLKKYEDHVLSAS
jgi:3-dehydroquinate dehydratase type I